MVTDSKKQHKEKATAAVIILALTVLIVIFLPPTAFDFPTESFVIQESYQTAWKTNNFHEISSENINDSVALKLGSVIEDLQFHNLSTNQSNSVDVRIDYISDEIAANWSFDRVYAIDPSQVSFEIATLTATAKGKHIYKCEEWNFDERICNGDWKYLKSTNPGEKYTLDLTPKDPAFAESSVTSKPIIRNPGLPAQPRIKVMSTYTFSNGTNKAYNGTSTTRPPATSIVGTEATSSAYTAISYSDNSRWYTTTQLQDNRYAWERFVFNISEHPLCINNVSVLWEGYGIGSYTGQQGAYGAQLFVLNNTAPAWLSLGTYASGADGTITGTLYSSADIINSSGNLVLLAQAYWPATNRNFASQIWTDFVNVSVDAEEVTLVISPTDSPDPVDPGQNINITASITNLEYIDQVIVEIDGGNNTMNLSGSTWYYDEYNTSAGAATAGLHNYTIYATNLCGDDATPVSGNFTINALVSISLTNAPINFSSVQANQITNATVGAGWPIQTNNLGNVPIKLSVKGFDLIGQSNSTYLIRISNVTWSLTSGFTTQTNLTENYVLFNSSVPVSGFEELYFKLYAPKGITTQNYVGNISIFAEQA